MSEKEEKSSGSPETVNIKVNFRIPTRMPGLYAHHMLVQPGEQEVTISFFEVIPPLFQGDNEEQLKKIQEVGLTAECIARIIVSNNRFPGFAAAMQQVVVQISSELQEETENASASRDNQQDQ